MSSVQTPHTSREFDQQLGQARDLVLEMGARVERQVDDALRCLASGSDALADQVLRHEAVVNALERSIDELVGQIIARRQPAASDLRLLTALIKTTTDLERIGDEAKKIALCSRKIGAAGRPPLPRYLEIRHMGSVALEMLRAALVSLERLDLERTAQIVRMDDEVDDAFRAVLRQLITYMIEDPRTISGCLDIVFVAKALERVGDHAKNISEYVVYAVKGKDVRHISVEEIEREVGSAP
ncbi:MAG TPA: phosphate signaling complex protein PhoU [Burkholderiales bacterium]|nr:phosphate signaling complex protein PhoU [Burkholderiales bacterium]